MSRKKVAYPIIQIIAPIRDKINDNRAKGNPMKKPKGLHSQKSWSLAIDIMLNWNMFLYMI